MNTTATIKAILGYAQPTVVGVAIATLLASQSAGLAACPKTAEDKSNQIMACKTGGDCTKPSLADQTTCIYLEELNGHKVFCECAGTATECELGVGSTVNVRIKTHSGQCFGGACFSNQSSTASTTTKQLAVSSICAA